MPAPSQFKDRQGQKKSPELNPGFLFNQTGPTRLELATSGVTGRRSNQLNYDPGIHEWAEQGLNL